MYMKNNGFVDSSLDAIYAQSSAPEEFSTVFGELGVQVRFYKICKS